MGYQINDNPPRRWFAGRVFLEKAKAIADAAVARDPVGLRDLMGLSEGLLNTLRGVRAAFRLAPDPGGSYSKLVDELATVMTGGGFRRFSQLFQRPMEVTYAGSGQDGVPNYDLKDARDGRYHSATDQRTGEFQDLLRLAHAERLARLNELLRCAMDLFFEEVYLPDRRYDIEYYGPLDYLREDEIYEQIVSGGLARTIEEAREKYPEPHPDPPPEVMEVLHREHLARFKDIHHSSFWEWREESRMFHGSSG